MNRRDERADNEEELRKLDVGRGNGEVQRPGTAVRGGCGPSLGAAGLSRIPGKVRILPKYEKYGKSQKTFESPNFFCWS